VSEVNGVDDISDAQGFSLEDRVLSGKGEVDEADHVEQGQTDLSEALLWNPTPDSLRAKLACNQIQIDLLGNV
jgi:hypothetical protein